MVKYPGPSHRRKLSPSQAYGVSGELGRAVTAEELSQSQDHSNQVGREQGNTSSLFPPPTGCSSQKPEGQRAQLMWSREISLLGHRAEHRREWRVDLGGQRRPANTGAVRLDLGPGTQLGYK